ncbi:bifunctional phosphoribosylaminoimidazolecarboxamide formyltransferase/IMP cyclohydrolase [Blochmannia endosymbiont of Polyrhachis (Hedomyrma) turneri]|uniref:bifunctional phosphoribosylaminoimidazolecarboxamide formyltransferase/IMP cyclohydrolase n=1 Tax=Blochmannia endosymbiont of Polyrhachis (Hedomyrma) turneri TaxID=1505596 RepID=UPI00061A695D|nr:bifunctional phosphoribosylaminoimidazolecarboxamide formyltransferase/IMP cyclohydrolase [Blochmannia endosymbiont of Polyrhachis (Hedomyrma) turneri]AKC60112.1 Bifunctional purine biosynthesis protein PurH [Blochmannia endosymbiont of Polyrhachis (Hedomyrma) turneri]
MCTTPLHIRRALISVSNKLNILEFAHALAQKNIHLLASGGTAETLSSAGLKVTEISQYTNFPEIMNGRIKTLHTKIYAGILARPQIDNDIMQKYSIKHIDMVIINFYPLTSIPPINKDIKNHHNTNYDITTDNIDIGGPSIVRSAAKNYKNVLVIVDIKDYTKIIDELNNNNGKISIKTRLQLATKAFQYVATYDTLIANNFKKQLTKHQIHDNNKKPNIYFPHYINCMNVNFTKKQNMRYGENPHQIAAFYTETYNTMPDSISQAEQLQGKKLSYNNIIDIDTAWECVKMFTEPTCAIIKHGTPCGVSSSHTLTKSYQKAYQTDPDSAFGGIIAFNKTLDKITAQSIIENQFTEAIIAPCIHQDAIKTLNNKKNIRILTYKKWKQRSKQPVLDLDYKRITGGLLIQNRDYDTINKKNIQIVTIHHPNMQEINDALFCWKIVQFVKSNAIVYGKNKQTIGIGAGQTSRIYAAKIATLKAKDAGFDLKDAVMASDAFFPFPDTIELAASMGIKCIIQPGGGIQDKKIIASANKNNISMIFTNIRHFRH